MALWIAPAIVIEKETFDLRIVGSLDTDYVETADINAVATGNLTDVLFSPVETLLINSVGSLDLTEIYAGLIGAVTAPIFVVEATGQPENIITGALTNPIAIVEGSLSNSGYAVGAIFAPRPEVTATGLNSSIGIGSVTAPTPEVTGYTGITGNIQAPAASVTGTGFTGLVGEGSIQPSIAQVVGTLTQVAVISGDIVSPKSVVSGQVASGVIGIASVEVNSAIVIGAGFAGAFNLGAVTIPSPEVVASLYSENLITGGITTSLPLVQGVLDSAVSGFITWVMNAEGAQVSNYIEFPFIALGYLGESNLGAAADGIYLLEGDDDAGTDIDATFTFGMADFRAELVNAVDAYVSGSIEADMELNVIEAEQATTYTYSLLKRDQHVRGHHAKLGKGFRSQYRQLSINNVDGGDFTLDSLALSPVDIRGKE